ncbi:MAG: hypothetical protein KF716_25600 [Anaerolineae bacterium]|nr:hypothetical protein [Anaerolineae bacterium]
MNGYATFKSHVLRRDEKGLLGIPFKRWLGAGLGGAVVMTLLKIFLPDQSLFVGLVAFILTLYFTSPHGGIARWQRLLLKWQWSFRMAAAVAPDSLLGQIGTSLQLSVAPLDIDGTRFFRPIHEEPSRTQLTDWVSFLRPLDVATGDGLVFSKQPALRLQRGGG